MVSDRDKIRLAITSLKKHLDESDVSALRGIGIGANGILVLTVSDDLVVPDTWEGFIVSKHLISEPERY